MSKYTTQLRYICEELAGLTESSEDIEAVIEAAQPKIFDFTYPFFTDNSELISEHPELTNYKTDLEKKIISHYYLQEIGCETYGIFKHFLKNKMREIIPYYNQLYISELLDYNPLTNNDGYEMFNKSLTGNNQTDSEENGQSTSQTETSGTKNGTQSTTSSETTSETANSIDKYSDTPQAHVSTISDGYLTNIREVSGTTNGTKTGEGDTTSEETTTGSSETTATTSSTGQVSGTHSETETSNRHIYGKHGGTDYADLVLKYRQTFINIDNLIIEELSDLFFKLW